MDQLVSWARFPKARTSQRALLALCLALFAAIHAFGQSATANLTGQVIDPSGAAIPGADLTVTNVDTNLSLKATSNNSGAYLIPALPPGTYTLTADKAGFRKAALDNIMLSVGQSATLNVHMSLGTATDTVTVTSGAELLNTTSAEIGAVIGETSIKELPLNGRDPSSLVLLTTGVSDVLAAGNVSGNGAGWKNAVTMPTENGASAGGGRQGSTYYLLDGAPNMDTYHNLAAPFPNADATQEFRAITNNFDARYGFSPAAVVTIATKSGSNSFHGGVFEFIRNNDLNAGDYWTHMPNLLKRNQFGGFLGGPIKKDKLFFFVNYQATKASQQAVSNSVIAIDQRMLNGDFSEIPYQLNMAAGFDAHNQINPNKFSPGAVALLHAALPVGTSFSTPVIYASAPIRYFYNEGTARLDYQATQNQRITLRSFNQYTNQPSATINGNYLSTQSQNLGNYINETLGHTWIINPSMVNSLTLFWNGMDVHTSGPTKDPNGNLVCLSKYINIQEPPGLCDFQGIIVAGSYGPTFQLVYNDLRTTYGFNETFNFTHGNHSMVAGATVQHQRMQDFVNFPSSPLVGFFGGATGSGVSDYLLGDVGLFLQGGGEAAYVRGYQTGLFAQDQYKVRPNLTLTLGVRWDPNTPPQVTNGRGAAFHPGQQSTVFPNAPVGLVFVGDNGVTAGLMPAKYNIFEPRIGVAYQPSALPHTSIRAGFGLFSGPLQYSYYSHASSQAPWSPQYSLPGINSFDNPWVSAGIPDPFPPFNSNLTTTPPKNYTFIGPTSVNMSFSPNFQPETTQSWNFSVDQQIGRQFGVHLAYVGSESYHLAILEDVNPGGNGITHGTYGVRPYAAFSNIDQDQPTGTASYNSLQLSVDKHMSHGLQFGSNFTWSKAIDTASNANPSNAGGIGNPFDLRWSRGISDLNVPFIWVSNFVYSTPALRGHNGFVRSILGAWEVSGIFTMRTGSPFSIGGGQGTDPREQFGGGNNSGSMEGGDRADVVPGQPRNIRKGGQSNWLNNYFNTKAFVPNAYGTYGNSGRNILTTPPLTYADAAFMKNWEFRESLHLQFRWEMFNAFNHPSFGAPQTDPSPSDLNFGKILPGTVGAIPPRVMQAGVKLTF